MIEEPPIRVDEDTHPTQTVRQVQTEPRWHRVVGLVSLLGAIGLTLATIVLLVTPAPTTVIEVTATPNADLAQIVQPPVSITDAPSEIGAPSATTEPVSDAPVSGGAESALSVAEALPTLDPQAAASLLAKPLTAITEPYIGQIVREGINPFTVIPDRPRTEIVNYTIDEDDTIYGIAQQFGISAETLAWSNDKREVWVLTPGASLRVLPFEGVVHIASGSETLAAIAAQYEADPMAIIDTPLNEMANYTPEDQPVQGMEIVVPGGKGSAIDWSPRVIVTQGTSSSSGTGGGGQQVNLVSFEPGSGGSCGAVEPGVGSGWQRPLANYQFMRGFSSFHPGIDLAAPTGTPVAAANSGKVIFAGYSNWGYGNAIVISSGPYATLYGHLNAVNVGCEQVVSAGTIIGEVGSTGNSSGPHLHFEIQYNGVPGNPAATLPF